MTFDEWWETESLRVGVKGRTDEHVYKEAARNTWGQLTPKVDRVKVAWKRWKDAVIEAGMPHLTLDTVRYEWPRSTDDSKGLIDDAWLEVHSAMMALNE